MSEWTVDTLKEHIEAMLAQVDLRLSAALQAADRATTKAETAMDRRLEGMNEFRSTISDMTGNLVTRSELKADLKLLKSEADGIKDRLGALETGGGVETGRRKGTSSTIHYVYAAVGAVVGIGGLLIGLLS